MTPGTSTRGAGRAVKMIGAPGGRAPGPGAWFMAFLRHPRSLAAAAVVALALSFAIGPMASWSPLQRVFAAQAVDTGDYYFAPGNVSISVGDTVTWTNSSGEAHTVTGDDGSWGTDDLE